MDINVNAPINEFVSNLNIMFGQANYRNKKFFDEENPEFYVTEFYYDSEHDKLFYKSREEVK